MCSCTFIGHHTAPKSIKSDLTSCIINLIENQNVTTFYFGTHGKFDFMVEDILTELKQIYPLIKHYKVLAYLPKKDNYKNYANTIYPDLENVPLKYAIIERNKWMINKCDYLICYVTNTMTNAYNFLDFARKKNKNIINLSNILP